MLFENEKVKLAEKQKIKLSTSSKSNVVDDKFEVLKKVGEGGYGIVYKVRRLEDKKIFALKVLKVDFQSDKTALKRFQLEAKNLDKVKHKNLVQVEDHGFTDNGTPYILMEYFESVSLKQLIEEEDKGISFESCMSIFKQVCQGVEAIHDKGIIHRDLTCKNILIQKGEKTLMVKLVDFGIAKTLPSASATTQGFTETGKVFGTPDYMSPEQCMSQKLTKTSDVYSIGCCLYEAISGSPPFKGANAIETMLMHTELQPKALDKEIQDSKMLNRIVAKALEKSPKNRYPTAKSFKDDLSKLASGLMTIGPLYPKEKLIALGTVVVLMLCLVLPKINTNPNTEKNQVYLEALSAPSLIQPLPEWSLESKETLEDRINFLVEKTREAGKKIEAPWSMRLLNTYKYRSKSEKGAEVTKYHNQAKLTNAQAVYEAVKLGPKATPLIAKHLNDDVSLVRAFAIRSIKETLPFQTKALAKALVQHKGIYYDSSFKLMAQGGSESIEELASLANSEIQTEQEKAVSLIVLTMMSANRNFEITDTARDNLLKALSDKSIKNRYLLPSILIILRTEDPKVKSTIDNLLINDKNANVRMAAASALGFSLNQPFTTDRINTLELLKKSASEDPSKLVTLACISNLVADHDKDSRVKQIFKSYLLSQDLQIKYAATTGLILTDIKNQPYSEMTVEEKNSMYSATRSDEPISSKMIYKIAKSYEQNSYSVQLSKKTLEGIELPLIIHRLSKTNSPFRFSSAKQKKYIAVQTWLIYAGYSARRSSSRDVFARSVLFSNTIRYKNRYTGREY